MEIEWVNDPERELMPLIWSLADETGDSFFTSIIHDPSRVREWTVLRNEGRIVAFSGLQYKFFPEGCVRFLTRSWYHPSIRKRSLSRANGITPALMMAIEQKRKFVMDADCWFISMKRNHRKYLGLLESELEKHLHIEFELMDGVYDMCGGQSLDCHQVVLAGGDIAKLGDIKVNTDEISGSR